MRQKLIGFYRANRQIIIPSLITTIIVKVLFPAIIAICDWVR